MAVAAWFSRVGMVVFSDRTLLLLADDRTVVIDAGRAMAATRREFADRVSPSGSRWASSAVTNEFRSGLVGVIVDGDLYSK